MSALTIVAQRPVIYGDKQLTAIREEAPKEPSDDHRAG